MFLFVVYAMGVWYGAMRWRRRWGGVASISLGVGGLLVVLYLHTRLNEWLGGTINLQVVRGLVVPYIVLVAGVGVFLLSLPRAFASWACPSCGYDLRGLELDDSEVCPECGWSRLRPAPRRGPPLPHRAQSAAERARPLSENGKSRREDRSDGEAVVLVRKSPATGDGAGSWERASGRN